MYFSSILENFPKLRIFVIGDVMLDRYFWGDVQRISPEAPVPILRVSGENLSLGGAANVATNLRSLGATVEIFGIIGRDREGENLIALLKQIHIDSKGIISDLKKLTATKARLIAENQQIARIDREETSPISDKVKNHIMRAFTKSAEENTPHGIIISDYAKGLVTEDLSNEVIQFARRKGIFVCIDPKGKDFSKYKGANVITPNQKETEELCGFPIEDDKTLKRAAEILIEQTDAEGILITRGRHGISFYVQGTHQIRTIHSDAREVFDVTGAGDTVVSAFTLSYIASKSWEDSVRIANCAAGIVVGRIGTATVTQQELAERFNHSQYLSNNKILTRDLLSKTVFRLREDGKRIVFTNGCFDLFHIGHLKLLKQAKEMGDVLVVGINSEHSVKRLKGEGRPFIGENDRANIIAALDCVDYVALFEEDTPLELIKTLKPDLVVKGGDYPLDTVVGKDFVESYGGKVFIIPLVEGISTSLLVDKIRNGI
jgi:D-beta-D-heptose 7-phosphate kinase/D-beta-D-heptose 1-phosphate adenosyltransferase